MVMYDFSIKLNLHPNLHVLTTDIIVQDNKNIGILLLNGGYRLKWLATS